MKYKGIIITGTSGSGKSTIAEIFTQRYPIFMIVQAVTTRQERADDSGQYIYLDDENFKVFHEKGYLLSETKYRGKSYGISVFSVEEVQQQGKIPVMVISPESISSFKQKEEYISFFVDATDMQLNERLHKRSGKEIDEDILKQRENDRNYVDEPNYIIKNNEVEKTINLIFELWNYASIGGVIPERIIQLMISCGMLVENANEGNIKSASYDLTLGDEYYYGGEIRRLEKDNLFLKIEPYDYAIVSCHEQIQLPKDVAANFGLTVGLFCQGIILSNGQQVDPGFRGTLFCLLFNTSNRVVTIKRRSHYATIEFTKMLDFASRYKGKYQGKRDILDVIPPNVMQGAINELKMEIEELRKESRNLQNIYIGVIAIIMAAISILLVVK